MGCWVFGVESECRGNSIALAAASAWTSALVSSTVACAITLAWSGITSTSTSTSTAVTSTRTTSTGAAGTVTEVEVAYVEAFVAQALRIDEEVLLGLVLYICSACTAATEVLGADAFDARLKLSAKAFVLEVETRVSQGAS